MDFSTIATQKVADVLATLHSSLEQGLTDAQVKEQQQKEGFNELKVHEITWVHILVQQVKSPFILLLLGACIISYFLQDHVNAIIIMIIIVMISLLGFYQEYGAYKTVEYLHKFIVVLARVRRNGKEKMVPSRELVRGDIIIVEAGDIIPADVRFLQEYDLQVDESIITGESAMVRKIADPMQKAPEQAFQAENIGFSGTTVVSGKAWCIVIGIGKDTLIGNITKLAAETPRSGIFERDIRNFSNFILRVSIITLVCVVVANLLVKGSAANITEILLFALALAVAVTPEALPLVTTFALARGARRLAQHKVVVKRLSAIDDLGSIQVLCVDKTGTLTENKLTIKEVHAHNEQEAILYACLSSTSWQSKGEPVNGAIDISFWQHLGPEGQKISVEYEKVFEVPFDAYRRRNTTVVKRGDAYEIIVRGAAETVLESCKENSYEKERAWAIEQGKSGNRVIAVARKAIPPLQHLTDVEQYEKDLTLLGLVSFEDPVKKTVPGAIVRAQKLGLIIKIISGDAPEVVGAVAHTVGLAKTADAVVTGAQFEKMSTAEKHKAAAEYAAFARFAPQQKYDLIKILQEKYEVGYLGDGINDAPALKIANVALVVQGAADVARESADIILLKKSLSVIVDGIQEGRVVFVNTIKYVKIVLASNIGNFYTIALASLVIDYLPLLPLQILLLNLMNDIAMISLATDKVDEDEVSAPTHFNIKDIALFAITIGLVSSVFDFIFFSFFYHRAAAVLQTNWFIENMCTQMPFIYLVRTRHWVFKAHRPSWPVIISTITAIVIAFILPYTWFGQKYFKFIRPDAKDLLIVVCITVVYLCVTECVKIIYYRIMSKIRNHNNT